MSTTLDVLYMDLFTTALEGGVGYWSQSAGYGWSLPGTEDPDYEGFYADLVNIVEEDADHYDEVYVVDRSTIARGYRLATTDWRHRLNWSTSEPPVVVGPETDWDFDAGDADMIVQLGLFGEVVYG